MFEKYKSKNKFKFEETYLKQFLDILKNSVFKQIIVVKLKNGGENGIRTHERVAPLHAFQACALNRSAISPKLFFFDNNYLVYISIIKFNGFNII